jgi:hypothetical protein
MTDGINSNCPQRRISKPRRSSLAALIVAASVTASVSPSARADDRVRVEGTFSVFYAYPSAVNFCGDGAGGDGVSIQATGSGDIPGLGALFLTVRKCLTLSAGTYAGSFTMSAANGDALHGTYEGTQGAYDQNGFSPFWGTLTIARGTGRFRHTTGQLRFGATSGPDSVGAIAATYNGMAFYIVRGTLVSRGAR